jgi:hypothetical protein
MPFDQTKVGQLTADLMESMEQRYSDDSEIGDVLLIVEVVGPHGSEITSQSSSARRHVNLGLLSMAERLFSSEP